MVYCQTGNCFLNNPQMQNFRVGQALTSGNVLAKGWVDYRKGSENPCNGTIYTLSSTLLKECIDKQDEKMERKQHDKRQS